MATEKCKVKKKMHHFYDFNVKNEFFQTGITVADRILVTTRIEFFNKFIVWSCSFSCVHSQQNTPYLMFTWSEWVGLEIRRGGTALWDVVSKWTYK